MAMSFLQHLPASFAHPGLAMARPLNGTAHRRAHDRRSNRALMIRHQRAETKAAPYGWLFNANRAWADPRAFSYSMMLATTPAPTVRPPSRMAKRSFSSMAMGTISATSMEILSPGITISVPSGSVTTPVTSVVRK